MFEGPGAVWQMLLVDNSMMWKLIHLVVKEKIEGSMETRAILPPESIPSFPASLHPLAGAEFGTSEGVGKQSRRKSMARLRMQEEHEKAEQHEKHMRT